MTELFFGLLYIGGWFAAYPAARNNNFGSVGGVLQALVWPADVGWRLAKICCADVKP